MAYTSPEVVPSSRGLDKMIEEKTTLKVFIPEEPLLSIVKGAGAVLNDFSNMKKVCIN